jgi:hypothetical protein
MLVLEPHEVGEWIAVGGILRDPRTGQPVDLTGCVVTVTVRRSSKTGTIVVNAAPGEILDPITGDVQAGFRVTKSGTYVGTITADKNGAPGWPVKAQFEVPVVDAA